MKEQREEGIQQYNKIKDKTGLPKIEEFEEELNADFKHQ